MGLNDRKDGDGYGFNNMFEYPFRLTYEALMSVLIGLIFHLNVKMPNMATPSTVSLQPQTQVLRNF